MIAAIVWGGLGIPLLEMPSEKVRFTLKVRNPRQMIVL